jgi:hypothetical protein
MDEYITLNVGGSIYTTTRTNLTTAEPNSMLARLCHLDANLATEPTGSSTGDEVATAAAMPAARRDASGNIVIDRDGPSFRHVLNYLRDGQECALPGSVYELQQLHREACYFSLGGLVQLAAAAIAREGEKDSARELRHTELVAGMLVLQGQLPGINENLGKLRKYMSPEDEYERGKRGGYNFKKPRNLLADLSSLKS